MFNFLIVSLAIWRFTSLLNNEVGFLYCFLHLRYLIGLKYASSITYMDDEESTVLWHYLTKEEAIAKYQNGELSNYDLKSTSHIGELFACIWCLSIWVAGIYSFFKYGLTDEFVIYTLAYSAMTIFIQKVITYEK